MAEVGTILRKIIGETIFRIHQNQYWTTTVICDMVWMDELEQA